MELSMTLQEVSEKLLAHESKRNQVVLTENASDSIEYNDHSEYVKYIKDTTEEVKNKQHACDPSSFALIQQFATELRNTYNKYVAAALLKGQRPAAAAQKIIPPTTLPPNSNVLKLLQLNKNTPQNIRWGALDSSGLDKIIEAIDPKDAKNNGFIDEKFILEIFSWLYHRPLLPHETNWPPPPAITQQRNLLKSIIHQIYLRFHHHRRFIRKHLIEVFSKVGLMGVQEVNKVKAEMEKNMLESRKQLMLQRRKESTQQQQQQPQPQQPQQVGGNFARPTSRKRAKVSGKDLIASSSASLYSDDGKPINSKEKEKEKEQSTKPTKASIKSKERTQDFVSLAGLSEMLEVMGSIIQGFKLPLREEHVHELLPAVLSLHGLTGMLDEMTPVLAIYHKALSFCVAKFIEKDPSMATNILLVLLLRLWPKWNSKQEVLLWNELEEVLEHCIPATPEFREKALLPLVQHLTTRGLSSPNFVIAQRALILMSNGRILELFDDHKCYATFVSVLFKTATEHFNDTTKQMCYQLLLKFAKMEPSIYEMKAMRSLISQFEAREKAEREAERMKKLQEKEKKTDLDLLSFAFGRTLGDGSYSQVRHAKLIGSHPQQRYWGEYALKIMSIQHLKEEKYLENALNEAAFLYNLSHPFIISVLSFFEEDGKLYIVMEYAPGGDVFHILERMGSVDEQYAKFIIAEMVSVLEFLHTKLGIVHLDIKPENILLTEDGHIRLTDFGGCKKFREPEKDKTENKEAHVLQGTAEYLSPELIAGSQPGPAADLWALGCLLYQLLAGKTPFNGEDKTELFNSISNYQKTSEGEEGVGLDFPKNISDSAKDLIEKLLTIDPRQRVALCRSSTVGDDNADDRHQYDSLKAHPFFAGISFDDLPNSMPPKPSHGHVATSDVEFKLRQRKYSMMLTKAIPRKYAYQAFALSPIPEVDAEQEHLP